jgi:hypothetical protein
LGVLTLKQILERHFIFSSKLSTVWDSNGAKNKELLQKFIFPDGSIYDTINEAVLTPKAIASLSRLQAYKGF